VIYSRAKKNILYTNQLAPTIRQRLLWTAIVSSMHYTSSITKDSDRMTIS